jgi:hypothetical protein
MTPTITRRSLLQFGGAALAASAVAWPKAGRAQAAPGYTNVQIVDTGHGTNEAFLRPLADNGVKTIFRYYAQEDNLPGKNITPRERDMIFDHGLSVAIVYQHQSHQANRFTTQTGRRDARFCLDRAAEIAQPHGSTIFFGVDSDTHPDEAIVEYLTAVRGVFDNRFQIGCYGSGAHCLAALNAGVTNLTWVAEAPAWGGTRQFVNSELWTLYQNKTQIEDSPIMSGGGIPIDTNVLNPRFNSIGAFDAHGSVIGYDPTQVQLAYESRYFVDATELNVRDRPNGSVVTHMCVARTVHVLGIEHGWAHVDTNEDGRGEGYCSTDYLRPLNQMPAYVSGCTSAAL